MRPHVLTLTFGLDNVATVARVRGKVRTPLGWLIHQLLMTGTHPE